jgi:hypothetical protein
MKKTPKIHLVLVTAVLASCNRFLVPDQPVAGYSLEPGPPASDTTYCYFPNYLNFYFTGQPYAYRYRPASLYRNGAYWHDHVFIVRGGFGKASASTAS